MLTSSQHLNNVNIIFAWIRDLKRKLWLKDTCCSWRSFECRRCIVFRLILSSRLLCNHYRKMRRWGQRRRNSSQNWSRRSRDSKWRYTRCKSWKTQRPPRESQLGVVRIHSIKTHPNTTTTTIFRFIIAKRFRACTNVNANTRGEQS